MNLMIYLIVVKAIDLNSTKLLRCTYLPAKIHLREMDFALRPVAGDVVAYDRVGFRSVGEPAQHP